MFFNKISLGDMIQISLSSLLVFRSDHRKKKNKQDFPLYHQFTSMVSSVSLVKNFHDYSSRPTISKLLKM